MAGMTADQGAGGGPLAAWPALGVVLLVLLAALYSFAHRPLPPFPETAVHADKLLVNGLAQRGSRLVAAGELGHILIADSADGPWRSATVEPERGSTFTRAFFVSDKVALAVGHDGWIVRSADAGETWKEVNFDQGRTDPLLGVAGPFDGKLFAYGAFGLFLTSTDEGQTWQPGSLVINDASGKPPKPKEVDPNADPFANFTSGDSQADRHLNSMIRLADGSLLLVGERGLILQSRDLGASWTPLDAGYTGSFFGVLALPGGRLVAYGMRGNVFCSDDQGKAWKKSPTPRNASLFSGLVLANGDLALVGDNNTVLRSTDKGATFTVATEAKTRGLAAGIAEALELPGGALLTVGDAGIVRRELAAAGEAK